MQNKKLILTIILLSISSSSHIKSTQTAVFKEGENKEVTFLISGISYSSNTNSVFTYSATPEKNFAASISNGGNLQFFPVAPLKTTLNGSPGAFNPVYNQEINLYSSLDMQTAVTLKNNTGLVYVIKGSGQEVITTIPVIDVNNNALSKIVALILQNQLVYSANCKSEELFGQSDSAVTIFAPSNDPNSTNKSLSQAVIIPVTKSSPTLAINNPLAQINTPQNFTHSQTTSATYFATSTQSSVIANSGAMSIFRILISSEPQVTALSIVLNPNIIGAQSIIGTNQSGTEVNIYHVGTTNTSTSLDYLIVVGGVNVGGGFNPKRSVFAMPIVKDLSNVMFNGSLANIHSLPKDDFISSGPNSSIFTGRRFSSPAISQDQIYSQDNPKAMVGGAQLDADITKMQISQDAVIVLAGNKLYISQAIFDQYGRIDCWSNWQTLLYKTSIRDFAYDAQTGPIWYLTSSDPKTLYRANWSQLTSNNESPLEKLITSEFPIEKSYGVQNLDMFESSTQGLNQEPELKTSLALFSGFKKILLIQTANNLDGQLIPQYSDFTGPVFNSTDGSLNGFLPNTYKGLSISGGIIENLGPIKTSCITTNGTNGWLFVGGIGGISVLSDENGNGWNTTGTNGLGQNFSGLSNNFSFKPFFDFNNVRKLLFKNNYLFILTKDGLYRIPVNNINLLSKADIKILQVFDNGQMSDFDIIFDKLITACATGLFLTKSNIDIYQDDYTTIEWTNINLEEGAGSQYGTTPISRLFPIKSPIGANIHILNGSVSLSLAYIYRYFMNNDTFEQFPDYFTKSIKTFYYAFNNYRNNIYTNGALYLASRSLYNNSRTYLQSLKNGIKSGQRGLSAEESYIYIMSENSKSIGKTLPEPVSGILTAYGDFGIRILN